MRRAVVILIPALLATAGCGRSGTPPFEAALDDFPLPRVPGATATPTPFGTPDDGGGLDGALTVSGDTIVNLCLPLTTASGGGAVLPATAGIVAGRRVLFHQTQDGTATTGDPGPVASAAEAGAWEIARVQSAAATTLTLDSPLQRSFASDATRTAQVCTVREYTDVALPTPADILRSPAWDGASGGVVVFFASGTLHLGGPILASGRGFRGGAPSGQNINTNIVASDTSTGDGAGKGEGLDKSSIARNGRGNYFNAGGGGNANEAGGGGGGNGGAGGFGGSQTEQFSRNTECRGQPGAAITLSDETPRLVFGGGGGGGHLDDGLENGPGGPGGGLILVFARQITGTDQIRADGLAGVDSLANAAGGAGAAGTIVVRASASGSSFTGSVFARGGAGGNYTNARGATNECRGPGGGGGGGRVYLRGVTPGVIDVLGGLSGTCPSDGTWDATAGSDGVVATWDVPW